MKKLITLFVLGVIIISCKNEPKTAIKKENFPDMLGKVFEKHGGIDNWRKAKVLSFKIGEEKNTIDLQRRKSLIQAPNYTLGFDGNKPWLVQEDSTSFKGDPDFYHNLYFYFYAMPFVLADDGITYEETKPLEFEGKKHPGYKISYKANVGTSPDDNYFIYYNSETFQMEWLGYTVTYFSKKPSEKFNVIRYNNWENVNGFLLPKSITWYQKDDEGKITEPAREPTEFTDALVSQAVLSPSFFEKLKE